MTAKNGNRDDFSEKTRQILEWRVACVCSKPGCGRITRGPHSSVSKSISVGEAGHITAASVEGPRFDGTLTTAQRTSAENGVWLCRNCHRLVDGDASPFPAAELRRWKLEAEARARGALELGERRDRMPLVISALHRAMEAIPDGALARSLPLLLRSHGNREVCIDARDLFTNGKPKSLGEIVQRQLAARDGLWKMIDEYPSAEIAYYGIAHVPLAFHFGFLVGTRVSTHFAERDRDGDIWHWMDESAGTFPALEVVSEPEYQEIGEDALVLVSVSYEVTTVQVESSIPLGPLFHLSVESPALDIVRSKSQVEQYSATFRSVLENIARRSRAKRVHVFAATPMSLSFSLGRQVRTTVHPDVYVYNFNRNEAPPYGWRLLLSDDPARQN